MNRLTLILAIWVTLMLCMAGFKAGYEWGLDKSWTAYADEWVEQHIGEAR